MRRLTPSGGPAAATEYRLPAFAEAGHGRSSAARSRAAVRAVTRKKRQRPIPFYTISDALPPSVHYSFIRFLSGPFAYAVYDIAYDLFSCPLRALKVKTPFEIFRRKIRIFSHAEERQDT